MDHLILQDDKQVSVWYYDDYARELEAAGYLEAYRDAVWDREARKVFTFPGPTEWHPDSWVGRKSREWIDAYDGEGPAFCWASFSGPHFPFDPPVGYLDRVDESALGDPITKPGEFDDSRRIHHRSHYGPRGWIESGINSEYSPRYWRQLRHNYLANVALLDDEIGALVETAEAKFGDNLVVIFTSDHGEMLGNHGMWGKGNCFYEDVLSVPLLYRRPEQAGAGTRSDALVSLVDVLPTLTNVAGADAGTSDGGNLDDPHHEQVFSEGEGFQVVTDGRYKLVTVRKEGAGYTELFDLDRDPYEFEELAGSPAYAQVQRDLQAVALGALLESTIP
jgi:arylsulfatase